MRGFDVELIHMPATLASTALMTGDFDYNGAVSGVISPAVQGRPVKCLVFAVARPLMFLMSKKEIKEARDLKDKKVAGSTPGASVTLLAVQALRHVGLEPGRDVSNQLVSGLSFFPGMKIVKDLGQLRTMSPGGSEHEHSVFVYNIFRFVLSPASIP